MFTTVLVAKTGKQPRCPSVGEQITNQYIQAVEYYSAIKTNELSGHEKTREILNVYY